MCCFPGLPHRNGIAHAGEISNMAMDIANATDGFIIPHFPDRKLHIRIGWYARSFENVI